MYSGDQVYRPLIRVYVANMQQGFVKPCKYYLERKLRASPARSITRSDCCSRPT